MFTALSDKMLCISFMFLLPVVFLIAEHWSDRSSSHHDLGHCLDFCLIALMVILSPVVFY